MVFKLKNFLVYNTFESLYEGLYKVLSIQLSFILKKYFYINIDLKNKFESIKCLSNTLLIKTTTMSTLMVDTVQKFNFKILIYLPLIFINKYTSKKNIFYYLIGEFPIYDIHKTLIINGLKKTFISKLSINNNNIFFNHFLKGKYDVYYARVILEPKLIINIIVEKKICYIVLNSKKYSFVSFMFLLGVSLKDIFLFSRYSNSYLFKEIILKSNFLSNLDGIHYKSDIINLYYVCSSLYNIEKKNDTTYKIKSILGTSSSFTLIFLDFISILDLLLDLKYKKIVLKELYDFEHRSVSTLNSFYIEQFEKYIKKNSYVFKVDLINFIEKNKCLISNISNLYIKSKQYFKMKEYLAIHPLIQYLEQINSVSELMHKNRISNYNLKTTQNLCIRDVHLNQLGSICLIDTTEGINCGLVISFAKYTKLYKNTIIFPYKFILDYKTKQPIKYMTFLAQETYCIVFNNFYLRKNKLIEYCSLKLNKNSFKIKNTFLDTTIYIKPQNLFSYAENLIPFLFYNEPTRCLMGAKMLTQSVPTLKQNKSYIITGYEKDTILNSDNIIRVFQEGVVTHVTSYKIIIRDIFNRRITYYLNKYKKGNQNTIIHQKPNVWVGERVFSGQIITNNQNIVDSEFTVGTNLIISYGNFYGYNFEDAIVLNKKVLYKQLFTSLHFNIYEITYSKLKNNYIELPTLHIPKKSLIQKRNLDCFGFIKEGSKVLNNDIILSKIIIKSLDINLFSLTSLLYLLFGEHLREIKDKSLSIPFGDSGRVVKTEIYATLNNVSNNKYFLKSRVYMCKQRMLSVGDKLCGRYGNKGVIAYVAENNELPFSVSGFIPDIITDAIGVPSRLNIGQLFESLFGLSSFINNTRICITNTFNVPKVYYKTLLYNKLNKCQIQHNLYKIYNSYMPGKIILKDGRTGFKLNEPTFIGVSKYSKLIHMVKDKVHYRVIGPYTELMQQPVKGRSNIGGQRFGEMEIWALEAYGASYNLRELLNYKSDDIQARNSIQNNLLEYKSISGISTPEAFKFILRELNGLSLNIEAFSSIDQLEGSSVSININY